MPIAKIDDITMYYEIHGTDTPLILISGGRVDHAAWNSVVETLSGEFKVITFDNRGSGQTSVPEGDYSIFQMANDIALLCEHLDINEAYFIGHSMGGMILQALSYQYPKLVKKSIICNSALNNHNAAAFFTTTQLNMIKANVDQQLIIEANFPWLFSYNFLSQTDIMEHVLWAFMNNPHPITLTGYCGQQAAESSFDATPWADKIKVATLIISSTDDLIYNERMTRELVDSISNSQHYTFEKTGHLPQIEHSTRFFDRVNRFLHD